MEQCRKPNAVRGDVWRQTICQLLDQELAHGVVGAALSEQSREQTDLACELGFVSRAAGPGQPGADAIDPHFGEAGGAQDLPDVVLFAERERTGSAPGQLDSPAGLAHDERGRLYVADTNNYRVQVFRPGRASAGDGRPPGPAPPRP